MSIRACLVACLLALPIHGQGMTTRHYDEVVPLLLDPARVAVLPVEGGGPALAALDALGVADLGRRALPIGGVVLVDVPAGQDVSAFAEQLRVDAGLFVTPVFSDRFAQPLVATPTLLVRFVPGTAAVTQRQVLQALEAGAGARIVEGPGWAGLSDAWKLALSTRDGAEVLALANALSDREDVRFASPNWIFSGRSSLTPTDPLFGDSWGLHNLGQAGGTADEDMDAAEAWDTTLGDSSILVVVLDVGVEQDHPDIAQVPGEDFVYEGSGGDAFNACDHHGTAVAGCVSAIWGNGLGTVGVAPGCLVASARAFITDTISCNGSWWTYFESTPEALDWAETIGARVTNNSNFYGFTDAATEDKYEETRDGGMVHFACAGNFSVAFVEYPASLPTVVAVAASDRNGALAWFSSWGTGMGLTAPGESIMSTDRTGADGYYGGDYGFVDGTSFASPYAAGVAALVLSQDPTLSAPEVESVLFDSAVDKGAAGYDTLFGWGVVNARAALDELSAWTDEGSSLAGVAGPPLLEGSGPLVDGSVNSADLGNAAPSAVAGLFLALASTPVAFKGGTLMPVPFLDPVILSTSATGTIAIPFVMPPGVPAGTELWVQWAIQDGAAVQGVALSNAILGLTP